MKITKEMWKNIREALDKKYPIPESIVMNDPIYKEYQKICKDITQYAKEKLILFVCEHNEEFEFDNYRDTSRETKLQMIEDLRTIYCFDVRSKKQILKEELYDKITTKRYVLMAEIKEFLNLKHSTITEAEIIEWINNSEL
jgi:hypothetical protein